MTILNEGVSVLLGRLFLFDGKLCFLSNKNLRKDYTAAERNYVTKVTCRRQRILQSRIPFYRKFLWNGRSDRKKPSFSDVQEAGEEMTAL